nr:DUF1489 family protein [uncultured Sphingomonas sp.]
MPLHLTKVAVGCASLEALENRIARRVTQAGEVHVPTRMRPKRADELIGGSLHWIVKHRIIAKLEIVRLEDRSDGRIDIVCREQLVAVSPVPRRAHQGWRYLEDKDAPAGDGDPSGVAALPPRLYGKLAALMLV